ncbi:hypothetical protein SCHPADRAFT_704120 [Schizopora paradoxa]|uniref:Uncharacterized protein n=1 Tax=Schizopora paradoxa TaxID=27342 RepID=A0A0H2R2L7_9AGAM|nr:hypothetical protein SCHPADRAFT_704120 [Schizopora paradoxa]
MRWKEGLMSVMIAGKTGTDSKLFNLWRGLVSTILRLASVLYVVFILSSNASMLRSGFSGVNECRSIPRLLPIYPTYLPQRLSFSLAYGRRGCGRNDFERKESGI